ncbi:hypothetical protein Anas_02332 [Armadillidium nasatum]|uniref:Uncharacterized protein n=1 Tax=Armadillidium nasatum TaxID=96803 RepID=A0A5N5TKC5_9CRUS|nr:hypothetical protein Anas_02332 [Armadillidium nasatum]
MESNNLITATTKHDGESFDGSSGCPDPTILNNNAESFDSPLTYETEKNTLNCRVMTPELVNTPNVSTITSGVEEKTHPLIVDSSTQESPQKSSETEPESSEFCSSDMNDSSYNGRGNLTSILSSNNNLLREESPRYFNILEFSSTFSSTPLENDLETTTCETGDTQVKVSSIIQANIAELYHKSLSNTVSSSSSCINDESAATEISDSVAHTSDYESKSEGTASERLEEDDEEEEDPFRLGPFNNLLDPPDEQNSDATSTSKRPNYLTRKQWQSCFDLFLNRNRPQLYKVTSKVLFKRQASFADKNSELLKSLQERLFKLRSLSERDSTIDFPLPKAFEKQFRKRRKMINKKDRFFEICPFFLKSVNSLLGIRIFISTNKV